MEPRSVTGWRGRHCSTPVGLGSDWPVCYHLALRRVLCTPASLQIKPGADHGGVLLCSLSYGMECFAQTYLEASAGGCSAHYSFGRKQKENGRDAIPGCYCIAVELAGVFVLFLLLTCLLHAECLNGSPRGEMVANRAG